MSTINRRVLRQILVEWRKTSKPLDQIVNSAFREHNLGSRDRRQNGDAIYLFIKHFPMLLGMDWDPQDSAATRELDKAFTCFEDLDKAPEALLQRHEEARPAFSKDPRRHLRMVHGIPEFLLKEIKDEELADWHDFFHLSFGRAPTGLRLYAENLSQEISALGAKASVWLKNAYVMAEPVGIFQTQAFKDGQLEIQDEHSQIIPELLGVQPGMRVLDLCAGAGGKTLAIASILGGKGEIFVSDVSTRRLEELKKRARRHGFTNIRSWNPQDKAKFDRILIDAPCSGLGTLRRTPERILTLLESECRRLESTQRTLLAQALNLAATDCEILYATCSIRPSENISQISDREDIERLDLGLRLKSVMGAEKASTFLTMARDSAAARVARIPADFSGALQFGPHFKSQLSGALTGDAFFIALVKYRNHEGKAARLVGQVQ